MGMTRVRVRRERPTALAWALALAVTMLVIYLATLHAAGPDVVESVSAAPRVTQEIAFADLEGWCVSMAACASPEEARLAASGYTARGAAGCAAQIEGEWHVLGAVYDNQRDARRIAERLEADEGIPAKALRLRADGLRLRITAPQRQIDAIAAGDALLRDQAGRLGQAALQLDRGELRPEGARKLCALAAAEASQAGAALDAIPGAGENGLCAGLIDRLAALAAQLDAVARGNESRVAALSGMLRCVQIDTFLGQRELLMALGQ